MGSDVVSRSALLAATCVGTEATHKGAPKVSLVGDERAIELAEKSLVNIHFRNQAKMQRFHEQREKLMAKLRDYEQQSSKHFWEVFNVDSQFLGRIIGNKGVNINRVRDEHWVTIETTDLGYGEATVTITGESAESVAAAKQEMDFVLDKIEIEQDQVGWVLGKGHENLIEVQKKSGLQSAWYNDSTHSIELCGLKSQVDDAKLMLKVHSEYLSVFQDIDSERRQIQKQFEELGRSVGGRKGDKGKGDKGKGKREDSDKGKGKGDERDKGKGKDSEKGKGKGEDREKGKGKSWDDDKGKGKSKGWDDDQDKGKGKGKGDDRDKGKGKNKGKDDDLDKGKGKGGKEDKGKGDDRDKGKGKNKGKDDDRDKGKGKGKGKGWDDDLDEGKGKGKGDDRDKGKGKNKGKDDDLDKGKGKGGKEDKGKGKGEDHDYYDEKGKSKSWDDDLD